MTAMLLSESFFQRPPDLVARALLGKLLVRRLADETLVCRITETEAYFGSGDPAAHSAAGRTARTEVLFGPPGRAYVYLIYGMHRCLNLSCEPEGSAGCVLLRAAEPVAGLDAMARLRRLPRNTRPHLLTAGPGRLCQALDITRDDNGLDVTDSASTLQVLDDGDSVEAILTTPRIGIRKAADLLARYHLANNSCVSKP